MFPVDDNVNPLGKAPAVSLYVKTLFDTTAVASNFLRDGIPAVTDPRLLGVVNATPTSISPSMLI